jgi:hypothetical protein
MHTILTGGRSRRRALMLALSMAALAVGMTAASAAPAFAACPSGAAAVTVQNYTLIHNGVPTTVTNLNGNIRAGDTVVANFTVDANCTAGVNVNFPSYLAPGSAWDASQASRQRVFDFGTGSDTTGLPFNPGPNSVSTTAPAFCFQVDLIRDSIIQQFSPPSGTYSAQNRLIAFGNGDPGCTVAPGI